MRNLNTKYKIPQTTNYLLLTTMFILALGERVFFDLGPNFELVTTALILTSFYIGRKESFWIIFLIMLFSDLIIGNSNIFLFTWSGFLIPAFFVFPVLKYLTTNYRLLTTKKPYTGLLLLTSGLSSNLFFFIWTNFGVWFLSGMYPKTASGLLMSYINALPFLKYQLISTLIFIPAGFYLSEIIIYLLKRYQVKKIFFFSPKEILQ